MADSYGITLTTPDGEPVKNALTEIIQITTINDASDQFITNTTDSYPLVLYQAAVAASQIAFYLFQLMTGTYVFNILYLFGIPPVFIVPIAVIYIILLARSLIALIRGI